MAETGGAYRLVVTKNNTGMPAGLNRYIVVGTLVTGAELPEPHQAPLVVASREAAEVAQFLGALGNPATHYEVREVWDDERTTAPVDLRLLTVSEILTELGRLVLRRLTR